MTQLYLAATRMKRGKIFFLLALLAAVLVGCGGAYETVAINDSQTTSYIVEVVSADKRPMGSRFYVVTPGHQELIDNAAMGDPPAQHVSIYDWDCQLLTTLGGPFDEGGVVRITVDGVPVFEPRRNPLRPDAHMHPTRSPACQPAKPFS